MFLSVGFSVNVRKIKIPYKKQDLWSRHILELLQEGYIQFLMLTGWSLTHFHRSVTLVGLSSDSDSQTLIPVVHPTGDLHTSDLLLNIEGSYPPHHPCLSFLMNLYPHFTVPPSGKLSHPASAILTVLYLCDLMQSSGSFYSFRRLNAFE